MLENRYTTFITMTLLILPINILAMKHKSPLSLAVKEGDIPSLQFFLYNPRLNPFIVNQRDLHGNSPLQVAITHNQLEAARLLIANDADVNSNNYGESTPFSIAISKQNKSADCALLLIENGANLPIEEIKLLIKYHGVSPVNERVVEDYKFIAPVHSALLCKQLERLHEQQENE